ncbi:LRR receptor-like serine/threonine-protein kinase FLS2 [Gossypium australe]|uniref:LRR receptor-like serine/threonine-protein kinase FLS2 n=1 Tax=Gossypium australe TaxID=47621 RepID=A0A5B6VII0_9ROSI|nr:LRR receptor-like serine/threonine-protein kinase FLS2 [Gossypium australe]
MWMVSIIKEIGQLKSLDSLDLSTDNLSGEISKSMSELSFLSVLDLSNNNLSGKILSSTQLQSFNAISYSGNLRLCREPLSKCPEDEPPKLPKNGSIERSNEGDEGLFDPLWFFIGMTTGFLVGFLSVNKLREWIRLRMALIVLNFGLGVENQSVRCIAADRRALLSIKKGLTVVANRLVSWTSEEEKCCNWICVGCDNSTGHVVKLDLDRMFTTGEIELLYLDLIYLHSLKSDNLEWLSHLSLKSLKISFTNFTKATIWLQVIQFHHSLSVLHFDHCDFLEVNPSSLSHFNFSNSLSVLHLTSSTLQPSTFPLLLNLSQNKNRFTKTTNWLQVIQSHHSLSVLHFDHCDFPEVNPLSLSHFNYSNSLSVLHLTSSTLQPSVFLLLLNLSQKFVELDFSNNYFSGGIPKFLGNICNLKELDLRDNKLNGSLEVDVKNLSRNRLTGALPDLSILSSLRKLSLPGNQLEGLLPVNIRKMSQLELLDVSSNSLHGVISKVHLFNLTKLKELSISFNSLSFNPSSD